MRCILDANNLIKFFVNMGTDIRPGQRGECGETVALTF